MIKDFFKTIALSLITLSLMGVAYAWTEPVSNPPTGNTKAPVTVGGDDQYKAGALGVEYLKSYGNTLLATDGGKVGIGTPAPNYLLDFGVAPGTRKTIALHADSAGNDFYGLGTDASGLLTFWTNNAQQMSIGSTGNVGVTGAVSSLGWDSVFRGGHNNGTRDIIGGYQGWDANRIYINGYKSWDSTQINNNLYVMDGNVGIGTTDLGAKLEVAGQVKITGGAPGVNKFLTSDATGLASWATLPAGSDSQILSLSGNALSISGGNSQIFTGWDTNASDDITSLTAGAGISISGSGNSRTIALPACPNGSFLQSNGVTYVCTTAQQPIVTDNFFLLSKNTYNGNLGGITGADLKCLTEVNGNDFYGKPGGKTYAASNVRAFICSTTFCNGTLSNTQYTMGRLGFPLIGGYKFTTDANGFGPNDSKNWSSGDAFGAGADYWSNRGGVATKWNNTTGTASDCGGWTIPSTAAGGSGRMDQSGVGRWNNSTSSCSSSFSLVCIVNK